jgi:ribonuclease HI
MTATSPHFLLFSESRRANDRGQWRFVLQSLDGSEQIEAADAEPDFQGERLELLAVVRGLEALPQPSRVTLVTPSRYVNRGFSYGLAEWRSNDWQWERYGEMAPVKNRDLWQRIDQALTYHEVDCRPWRFDPPATKTAAANCTPQGPHFLRRNATACQPQPTAPRQEKCATTSEPQNSTPEPTRRRRRLPCTMRRLRVKLARKTHEFWMSLRLQLGQLGTQLVPPPWLD